MNIAQALSKSYEALAPVSDRERSEVYRMNKTMRFIEEQTGSYAGKDVLELGSSQGLHLLAAKYLGASSVTGVDRFIFPDAPSNMFTLTAQDVAHLQSVWQREGVQMLDQTLDMTLPQASNSVDLVVCNAVIEHLHGIHKHVFAESLRVLKPGGWLVLTTPNLTSLPKRLKFMLGVSPLWDLKDYFNSETHFTGHVREFTADECRRMLEWSGFSNVTSKAGTGYYQKHWLTNPKKVKNVITFAIATVYPPFGELLYVAAQKPAA